MRKRQDGAEEKCQLAKMASSFSLAAKTFNASQVENHRSVAYLTKEMYGLIKMKSKIDRNTELPYL